MGGRVPDRDRSVGVSADDPRAIVVERDAPDAQRGNTGTECDGGVRTLISEEIRDADGLIF
jgi:hypothetical protein